MYRFLRSPKWLFGHALALVAVVAFASLGFWQLRRLDEVRAHNAHVEERLASAPVPLEDALADGVPYTRVTATGRYRADAQILTAPRSRDGSPGQHVLTPLETEAGPTVLVDRGWVPFSREGPAPEARVLPEGSVAVTGLLMPPEAGDPGDGTAVRTIAPAEVAQRTGVPLAAEYLQLHASEPAREGGPLPHADPVLDEGNHLSYAVQWFLFTGVVVIGYPILLRRTAREQGEDGDGPGSAPVSREAPAAAR